MGKYIDLSNYIFGKLTVVERCEDYVSPQGHHKTRWLCKCDCGNICFVQGERLRRGHTQSCGCLHKEIVRGNHYKDNRDYVHARYLLSQYKKNANKRDYEFKLSLDEFIELIYNDCYYCGAKPNNKYTYISGNIREEFLYNGIDRVDNTKGYIKNNVVSCCSKCNTLKRGATLEIAKKMMEYIGLL